MKECILEVKSLNKTFIRGRQKFVAVDDVTFKIMEGECLGLIGESGSGKSTIANLITGLIKETKGEIFFLGEKINEKSSKKNKVVMKKMQMVFQNPIMSFNPRLNVIDSICEGLRYYTKKSKSEMRQLAYEALEMVGLKKEYATKYLSELSGGQCQRVAIARAMIIRPKLIICDEVTSALDVSVQAQIIKLLDKLKKELNISYLFISHDLAVVSSICDRTMVMKDGIIVEEGITMDVINNPKNTYTKNLIKSTLVV